MIKNLTAEKECLCKLITESRTFTSVKESSKMKL